MYAAPSVQHGATSHRAKTGSSYADAVMQKYNVAKEMTSTTFGQLENLGIQKLDRLMQFAGENGMDGMKLMQEKENYRIYQRYDENERRMTMKGVITIHNADCEQMMNFFQVNRSALVRGAYSDMFGSQYGDSAVLYRKGQKGSSSSHSNPADNRNTSNSADDFAIHWLALNDCTPQMPLRDFVFMRYTKTYVTPDVGRAFRGISAWESVDLASTKPIFKPKQVVRSQMRDCGFIVETPDEAGPTYVTFVLSTTGDYPAKLQADRNWLMCVVSSVRHIPSANVNRRIRLNHYTEKSKWENRDTCGICTTSYTVFRRQHHCKMCGSSICSKCGTMRKDYNTPSSLVRVCLSCLNGESTSSMWSGSGRRPKTTSSGSISSMYGDGSRYTVDSDQSRMSFSSLGSASVYSTSHCSSAFAESIGSIDSLLESTVSAAATVPMSAPIEEDADVDQNSPFDYELSYNKGNAWPDAPIPTSEEQRLRRIQSLNLSQTWGKTNLKELLDMARSTANCPVAAISVVTASTSLLVTAVGLAGDQLPRDVSFEAHTIMSDQPLVVLETQDDVRFQKNPLVLSLKIRCYIGIPLVTVDGVVVGSLSLGDIKPRTTVTSVDIRSLQRLASRMVDKMDTSEMKISAASNVSPTMEKMNLYG